MAKSKEFNPPLNLLRSILFLILFITSTSFEPPNIHYSITRVVIDAGHGGHDSGCLGEKTKEKDVALAIALKLGNYIETHFPDVKVIYTRKTDVFVELHQRAEIANNARADLFICIHCNSACYHDKKKKKDICNTDSYGIETWVMGLHVAGANLEVAKRENEVVGLEKDYQKKYDGFDLNSPEANIIFSLYQNTYLDQSLRLASYVEEEVKKEGREPRGVKQAGFLVLYKTTMPSILVETGFLTNPAEEQYLASAKGQDAIANSIFKAFKSYKTSLETGESKKGPVIKVDSSQLTVDSTATGASVDSSFVELQNVDTGKTVDTSQTNLAVPINHQPLSINHSYQFSVQILLSSVKLKTTDAKFNGVTDIHEEKDGKLFKYTAGRVPTFSEAEDLQAKMKTAGFKDAFIVAYKNGVRIPAIQAREEMGKQ